MHNYRETSFKLLKAQVRKEAESYSSSVLQHWHAWNLNFQIEAKLHHQL